MNRYPRLLILLFIALAGFGACTSQAEKTVSELNTLLGELKLEYAPDDRIEWWEIAAAEVEGVIVLKGEVASKEAYKAVVQRVDARFSEVKNELLLLPEGDDGQLVNGLVNNSVIHLRREPSSTKELVTQALLGAPVRILKTEGGKSLIQIPDGYIGWVNRAEVHAVDREELAAYREAEKVVYTAQYGLSYSEPDMGSMPVTDLVIGNILSKVTEESGYTQVKYPDGRLGWVKSSELVPAGEIFFKTILKENLVQTALKYHGIPYLWGGTSSKNIDCSGLVSNVYFLNGIQLPRDADMQALIGRELTTDFVPEGLEPGDLLFFGRKASEGKEERVTHVAMYIGDGEYIHSAGYRERVGINSMVSTTDNFIESYPDIFVRAVRIIGEEYDGFRPISENAFYKEIISDTQ
ncbi:MAG: C40 family peptidase [Bacteroidales bacterium]|nr:C40 family peptidase [Bacteroidales bacterium]